LNRFHPCDALVAAALVSACAALPGPQCAPPASAGSIDRVYFGHARPDGGEVSDEEFQAFLREVVTPRYPQGLTLVRASGQWRSSDGRVVDERSTVLELAHAASATDRVLVGEIVDEYKRRFRQEGVLRVTQPACVAMS